MVPTMSPQLRMATLALLAAACAAAACSSAPPPSNTLTPVECATNDSCTCDSDCNDSCAEGNCFFQCNANSCTLNCPGGSCDAYVIAGASASLGCLNGQCTLSSEGPGNNIIDCPGGGCGAFCNGSTSCLIEQCTSNCNLRCKGVPDGGCVICQDLVPDGGTCGNPCGDAGGCNIFYE